MAFRRMSYPDLVKAWMMAKLSYEQQQIHKITVEMKALTKAERESGGTEVDLEEELLEESEGER